MLPGTARFGKKPLILRYFPADDGVHGRELRKTNGTEAGTDKRIEAAPGPNGTDPSGLSILGRFLNQ
jgi:ELWxxDGT repeat protein